MRDIKARLAAGEKMEDLMREMQNQVVAAARELEKEKQKNVKVEAARKAVIQAAIDYFGAIGVLPAEEFTEEDKKVLSEILKECEDELIAYTPIVKAVMDAEKTKADQDKVKFNKATEDIILRDFLKSL